MLDSAVEMEYMAPRPIDLTGSEQELYSRLPESPQFDQWHDVADAMESLFKSLLDRNAIPEARLRVFCDSRYAEKGKRSIQQVFESNGTSGNEIHRHPHFRPLLHYFIRGPELPKDAIEGLCAILNEERGTSGMIMDQYRKHARSSIRKHGLDPRKAATEFFRLGVEIGMDVEEARTLRDAARST